MKDINMIALSPDDLMLAVCDVDGKSIFVNTITQGVIFHFSFGSRVSHIEFSHCGRYLAVARGEIVEIWRSPRLELELMPMELLWRSSVHNSLVTRISWSADSRFVLSSSMDMTIRFYGLSENQLQLLKKPKCEGRVISQILSGHRDEVVGAWFDKDMNAIYSVGKDAYLYLWKPFNEGNKLLNENSTGKQFPIQGIIWKYTEKQSFKREFSYVSSCMFQQSTGRLAVGLSNGEFFIWNLPNLTPTNSLSASRSNVSTIAINNTGEWIAFGCAQLSQLLVWEWGTESYVLRQQGHTDSITSLAYSQDGQFIATGGSDNKVKMWDIRSNFCFVTFSGHTSAVTAISFGKQGKVVFSASLDGTVRAYDLIRYRNFRTFTSPQVSQFSSVDVNQSGEIVCAGSSLGYEIFVWSVQNGKLLEILCGHEAPLSCVVFNPADNGVIVTGSWDNTIRVWSLYSDTDEHRESFKMESDVLSAAFRPDGNVLACSTLSGDIYFWDILNNEILGIIEGRNHLTPGRTPSDIRAADNKVFDKHFTTLCYSSDGSLLLAAGNTPYVCLYEANTRILLRRFKISHNMSLGGMVKKLNSRYMTEAGPVDMLDTTGELYDLADRQDSTLPGVPKKSGDPSKRQEYATMRILSVKFSPTSRSWAAATTEGVFVYSLDDTPPSFDPYCLCVDITHESVIKAINEKKNLQALVLALRLGDPELTGLAVDTIPFENIDLVSKLLPTEYLSRALPIFANRLSENSELETLLYWCKSLLIYKAQYIKENYSVYANSIRSIQKITPLYEYFRKICSSNTNDIKYLLSSLSRSKNGEGMFTDRIDS